MLEIYEHYDDTKLSHVPTVSTSIHDIIYMKKCQQIMTHVMLNREPIHENQPIFNISSVNLSELNQ